MISFHWSDAPDRAPSSASEAEPENVTTSPTDQVSVDAGDEIVGTGGAFVGAPFETVTATGPDVVLLPAASRATAVSVCAPFELVALAQSNE